MKVCIPIDFRPEGGGYYVLEHFARHLVAAGHELSQSLSDPGDVLFTSHWMLQRHQVLRAVRANPHVRIVQRVDGAAQDYGRAGGADLVQAAVDALADLTIFQSEYCRTTTRETFGVIQRNGPVIHNPVDLERFGPAGQRIELPFAVRFACVTWSTNPRKGAAKIYAVARAHPDWGFVLVGRWPDAPALPNLHALGVLDREALARTLRSCHALVTFSENEACPNVVLEALASGLPVLFAPSGAAPELIADCGLPINEDTFGAQAHALLARRDELSRSARLRAEQCFSAARQFGAYLAEFETCRARPTAMSVRRRWWIARDPRAVARYGVSIALAAVRAAKRAR